MKILLFLATAVCCYGQTRVRPEQLRNPQQVRIYWGDGMGATTHVNLSTQQSHVHWVMDEATFNATMWGPDNNPGDAVTRVCTWEVFGIINPDSASTQQFNYLAPSCFTVIGLSMWRNDPVNDAWLKARGF